MKNCFVAFRRVRDTKGKIATVSEAKGDEGTFYLEHHPHKALKGKEFVSIQEAIQAVTDHQNLSRPQALLDQANALIAAGDPDAALELMQAMKPAVMGEVIILNVLEF